MLDYTTHPRSREWLDLIDAANDWQQAQDLLMYWESIDSHGIQAQHAAIEEQRTYDAWHHALVAFERAENGKR